MTVKTYIVESPYNEVMAYYKTLQGAKNFIRNRYPSGFSVLMMQGPYFGEGFHKYRLVYDRVKDKFQKTRLS